MTGTGASLGGGPPVPAPLRPDRGEEEHAYRPDQPSEPAPRAPAAVAAAIALALAAAALAAACEGDGSTGGATDAAMAGDAAAPDDRPIDFKVMIDRAALDPAFATADRIEVGGTFSDWQPRLAVDDGSAGDDVAGDGIFVFRLSDHRPPTDDLLAVGDREEFTVLLDGAAYESAGGAALAAGVSAWSTWVPRAVPGWERAVITHVPTDAGAERARVVIGPE